MSDTIMQRCGWAKTELMIDYHDKEWGVPLHDDRALFEFLILEGMQALLAGWGCDLGQGWHFGRPMAAPAFGDWHTGLKPAGRR